MMIFNTANAQLPNIQRSKSCINIYLQSIHLKLWIEAYVKHGNVILIILGLELSKKNYWMKKLKSLSKSALKLVKIRDFRIV